jgi:hypothetical protein
MPKGIDGGRRPASRPRRSVAGGNERDLTPERGRPQREAEDLLDIAAHLGGAEAFHRSAVADARQEVGRAVLLLGGQGRRVDPASP